MDRMKTKFIIAVTTRLAAAEDSNAKTDLIEELSENLYQRYLDLTAAGMAEDEAYAKALEDLGDVDELLAYLQGLGPDGELPHEENQGRDYFNEFLRGAEEVVRDTISQTKEAVDQAKIIFRDVAEKLKEKYPNGFDGSIHVHFDDGDDDHGEHPAGEDHEEERRESGRDWVVSAGYSKERGFFCERGQSRPISGTAFPSRDVRGVDVRLFNGDVTIHLLDDPEAELTLDGDTEQLELRLSHDGILSIRQGKTASSSFFFTRGLAAADVTLYLPRRRWAFLQVTSVNGDVTVDDGLEAEQLNVKTTSGDLELGGAACRRLAFKSASGDLNCGCFTGDAQIDTVSGDVTLTGDLGLLRCCSISGDIDVSGSVQEGRCISSSGDIALKTDVLPLALELSSKSGDCEAQVPESQGFTLQFSTVTGTLRTDFPLELPAGQRSGSAAYREGGDSTLRLSSVSGDIALFRL